MRFDSFLGGELEIKSANTGFYRIPAPISVGPRQSIGNASSANKYPKYQIKTLRRQFQLKQIILRSGDEMKTFTIPSITRRFIDLGRKELDNFIKNWISTKTTTRFKFDQMRRLFSLDRFKANSHGSMKCTNYGDEI